MTSSKTTSFVLLFALLSVSLTPSQSKLIDPKKPFGDRKFSKLHRAPKFPLFTKLKNAVMPSPSSPPPAEPTPTEMIMPEVEDDEEVVHEATVKATGVHVVPIKTPNPSPKATAVEMEPPPSPDCFDIAPDNVYSCAEQKAFGKCDADFMLDGNFCAKTCGRPPCAPVGDESSECTDIPPGPNFSCAEQREFGKCYDDFMVQGNYCARTCGRAPCPPVSDEFCPTIAEGVAGSSLLSVLDLALATTGLKDAFDDPELGVTVFAPTNAAFESLLNDLKVSADTLLDFPDVIEEILGVHVLEAPFLAEELLNGGQFQTMSEASDLEVMSEAGEVFVMTKYGLPAKVVSSDLDACGSIVHVIDSVLLPDREVLQSLNIPDKVISAYESKALQARG